GVRCSELDREQRPEPADLADGLDATCERLEACVEEVAELFGAAPELRLRHGVEDRDRSGARDRIAAERAAEAAGRDRVEKLGPAGDARERQPAAERLPRDEQVRLRVVVLDRPDVACAADAALDLVVDVEDPVPGAEL